MSTVTTYLWFNDKAEEAAEFYASVIDNSRMVGVGHGPDGKVMVAHFELDGQRFGLINGGPDFPPSEYASIAVERQTQAEIDKLWEVLTDGGEEGPCGWLKDRYGVSWQVFPAELPGMLTDPNLAKAKAAAEAMFSMKKIDIQRIKDAHAAA